MSKKINLYILSGLLCMTLLFTMGFVIKAPTNNHVESTLNPFLGSNPKEQINEELQSPLDLPDLEKITDHPLNSIEPPPNPVPANEEQPKDEPINSEVTKAQYEVTAYYLNVRAEADASSKILDVVTKGSILEVVKPTDNGWLELKSGGYIHGGYAQMLNGDTIQSGSDEQGAGKNVAVQAPAPQPIAAITPVEPSKPSSVVTSNSGLTEEHIAKIFKDTALEGEGLEKAVLEVEETYGINSFFTIAVMKLESGNGKSQLARTKNNLFGLNALDGDSNHDAFSFRSKEESVKEFGQIISDFYIDKGLTSVEKVAGKYCAANSNWPTLVKSIMNSDFKKLS